MKENELQMVATHLGHDVKTHKEYYRLSSATLELSKVGVFNAGIIHLKKLYKRILKFLQFLITS